MATSILKGDEWLNCKSGKLWRRATPWASGIPNRLESRRVMRKSASVLHLRNAFASALSAASCLLVLVLAGCGTDARRAGDGVPDWQTETAVTTSVLAPPAPPAPDPIPESLLPPPPPAPPTPTNDVVEMWVPLQSWCKANGLAAPCQVAGAPSPAYA